MMHWAYQLYLAVSFLGIAAWLIYTKPDKPRIIRHKPK